MTGLVAQLVVGWLLTLLSQKWGYEHDKCPLNKFLGWYLFSDNESNEISQEKLKSKKRWPDNRLQVFRSLLPGFVADSLCLAFLIYGGSLWEMKRQ